MSLEALTKEYEQVAGLYRFYLEFTLKVNTFYYVVTGAMLGFYGTHLEFDSLRWMLVVPGLMGAGIGILGIAGAEWAKSFDKWFDVICSRINFLSNLPGIEGDNGGYWHPEVDTLVWFARLTGIFILLTSCLCFFLAFNGAHSLMVGNTPPCSTVVGAHHEEAANHKATKPQQEKQKKDKNNDV